MSTLPLLGRLPSARLPIHGRPDNWTTLGRIQAGMVLDFTSASIADVLAAYGFAFTRASTATRINASGVMESVAAGAMRIEHDPVTGAPLGYLCEETSTNHVRNSTMVGVVAGSPGTLPTNWSSPVFGPAGISFEVVGTGTESGIAYIDIRAYGTPSATDFVRISMETNTGVAAATGQTWCVSAYVALVGGSFANTTGAGLGLLERTSGGAYVADGDASITVTSGALAGKRYAYARTLAGGATTGAVVPQVLIRGVTSGNPIDITLRIGAPQLEQKAFATSYIPTAGAAVTRLSDALRCSALGAWFLQSAGSLVARARSNSGVGGRVLMEFGTGGANLDRYGLQVSATSVIQAAGVTGGVSNTATTANAITTGSNFVAAGAYDASGKAAVLNGGSVAVSATGIPLSAYSIFDIGRATWVGAYFNGVIQMVAYYPRRLSNAELQSITT